MTFVCMQMSCKRVCVSVSMYVVVAGPHGRSVFVLNGFYPAWIYLKKLFEVTSYGGLYFTQSTEVYNKHDLPILCQQNDAIYLLLVGFSRSLKRLPLYLQYILIILISHASYIYSTSTMYRTQHTKCHDRTTQFLWSSNTWCGVSHMKHYKPMSTLEAFKVYRTLFLSKSWFKSQSKQDTSAFLVQCSTTNSC